MGSPKCSPWPPGNPRPRPPIDPQWPQNRSPESFACFSNHQKTHQMSLLILWDILPLPLWSVQSSTAQFRVQSRVYLADLSSPVWSCYRRICLKPKLCSYCPFLKHTAPRIYTASMNLFAVNQGFETEFNRNRNRMTAVEFWLDFE